MKPRAGSHFPPRIATILCIALATSAGYSQGNTTGYECGDAVYRILSSSWSSNTNYNHAGIAVGQRAGTQRCNEVIWSVSSLNDSTRDNAFSSFKNYGANYYGAYQLSNRTLSFSQRRAILATARNVVNANIPYTLANALDPKWRAPTPISVSNIDNLRCDGLVEYCYEANGFKSWWDKRTSTSRSRWNIAYYPAEHNNMPGWTVDPHFEMSPWAQRGAPRATGQPNYAGSNPGNAMLTRSAVVAPPNYSSPSYSRKSNARIRVRFTARDVSGIARMYFKVGATSPWSRSSWQAQYATRDSFSYDYDMTRAGILYYYAVDNAGNSPKYSQPGIGFYSISASAASGGSVSPAGSYVQRISASTSFTATPNSSYSVAQWRLDGRLVQTGGRTYTMRARGAASHALQVTFVRSSPVTISGYVRDSQGRGIQGVAMSGFRIPTSTNASGYYSGTVQYGWSGQVVASHSCYAFQPGSRQYSNLTRSRSSENYSGSQTHYSVSGYVRNKLGHGIANVLLSGLPVTTSTNASGYYSTTVPCNWTGSVTPSRACTSFQPASKSFSQVRSAVTQYFVATMGPAAPGFVTAVPSVRTCSRDNTVYVRWSAPPGVCAVSGYSILWSRSATSVPDAIVDTLSTSTTSAPLESATDHYLHVRAVDTGGNWGTVLHVGPFLIDTTAPTGSLRISAAPYTCSTQVDLLPSWSDTGCGRSNVQMRVRNVPGSWSGLRAAAPTVAWTLPSGKGKKTVEIQLRDGAGNESPVYAASTILVDAPAISPTTWSAKVVKGGASMRRTFMLTPSLAVSSGLWRFAPNTGWPTSLKLIMVQTSKARVTVDLVDLGGTISGTYSGKLHWTGSCGGVANLSRVATIQATTTQTAVSRGLYRIHGEQRQDRMGLDAAGAGDVNRDGYADVILGSPQDMKGAPAPGYAQVVSGKNGSILYTFHGQSSGDRFGAAVAGAGDVNRDGFADVVVGAWSDDDNGVDCGSVRVHSGKDGTLLHEFFGDSAGDRFGETVAGLGDVNRDGHADVAVGAPWDDVQFTNSGTVRVFSGKDGSLLHTFSGLGAGHGLGRSVNAAGDVNGDGFADVIAGGGLVSFYARVFSGKDGSVLHHLRGTSPMDFFGCAVDGVGDLDKDGYADVIVGAKGQGNSSTPPGYARVFSGRSGSVLFAFHGHFKDDRFGHDVAGAGDVDGDGYPDILVRAEDGILGMVSGSVHVYSGRDGRTLFTVNGSAWDDLGYAADGAGDVNGDGYADIVLGAWRISKRGLYSGAAQVVSGRALSLTSDNHLLSVRTGGSQTLRIDVGSGHAGRGYWLFGSQTGMRPGTRIGGAAGVVTVPLNNDSYTTLVMLNTNSNLFSSFRGTLDAFGRATARIHIPNTVTWLLGRNFYHSALIYDRASGALHMATNAVAAHMDTERTLVDSVGTTLRLIDAGEYLMGSPTTEKNRSVDEVLHRVKITNSFYIGVTEVTQAQWKAIMGSSPSSKGDSYPVESITRVEVSVFLSRLSSREKATYRLPTEAEFEYACRAGSSSAFAFGDDPKQLPDYAWYKPTSGGTTHPVGQKQPNAWGLYDMHGNVWEYCSDWYGAYPTVIVTDPRGPSTGSERVYRGGSWYDPDFGCRSAFRGRGSPSLKNKNLGFRVVREL